MIPFSVGNRVRYAPTHPTIRNPRFIGRTGTISSSEIRRSNGGYAYSIDWDETTTISTAQGFLHENLELIAPNSLRTLWSNP